MLCAMSPMCNIKSLMIQHAYKKAATKAPKPTMEPAATLRLAAAPAELEAPVPEAVAEAPEPEARPEPEVVRPDPVAPALLEAAVPVADPPRTMVVELLAETVKVRVELPVPATGMV